MNTSRRSRWWSKGTRWFTSLGRPDQLERGCTTRAARLAATAGTQSTILEPLEPRQLLAIVGDNVILITGNPTPDPNHPTAVEFPVGNGLWGTIVDFTYYLPWVVGTEPEPADPPARRYADFTDERIFGGRVLFIGPIGASATFLDLAGRDFHLDELDTRLPTGSGAPMNPVTSIDANDNGVPDFNYGIGSITFANTNAQSVFVITGALQVNQPGSNDPIVEILGSRSLYDAFEEGGFGLSVAAGGQGQEDEAQGLPSGAPGTIFIGSPLVRSLANTAAFFGAAPSLPDFNAASQGFFVTDGSSMGRVIVDGILFGRSVFTGALGELSVGSLLGSLRVDGDLGVLSSGGDAGVYFNDADTENSGTTPDVFNPVRSTSSTIFVGRTARSIVVGGRNGLGITVLGDINNPARRSLNQFSYVSRETILGGIPAQNAIEEYNEDFFNTLGQIRTFGSGAYRNDSIGSAEFIGHNGTSANIFGTLGGRDTINTGIDNNDVYAFAADPSREVVITGISGAIRAGYLRVVDKDGRVVASDTLSRAGRGPEYSSAGIVLRFRPERSDVYYLVLSTNFAGDAVGMSYGLNIAGMAPTILGEVRSSLYLGTDDSSQTPPFSLIVSNGSLGALRIGTSFVQGNGQTATDFASIINTNQTDNQRLFGWGTSNINVAGSIHGIWIGGNVGTSTGDINAIFAPAPIVSTGGNLGTLTTGQSSVIGRSIANGDMYAGVFRIGGQIALMDIRGALGARTILSNPDSIAGAQTVEIRTGISSTRKGHIGQILVGNYISGAALRIETSPGSQIDQIVSGAGDVSTGDGEWFGYIKVSQPNIRMGAGSDFRFLDYQVLENQGNLNQVTTLGYGQTLRLVDDAGAEVTIMITGGDPLLPGSTPGSIPPNTTSTVEIRYLPIDLSQGVAIAAINANLRGGAQLVITGITPGVVSLGRITVNASYSDTEEDVPEGGNPASILFTGVTEIDVARINVPLGALSEIRNITTGGDLVALDVKALDSLTITSGNLGRTQTSGAGAALLGPFLGITASTAITNGRDVGSPLAVLSVAQQTPDSPITVAPWNGALYSPTTGGNFGTGSLEDIGSPIDPYLNGIVVRNGDLRIVRVSGAVGDVIVETGNLLQVVANSDGTTRQGSFDGVVGSLYALNVGEVDVGDGLVGAGATALAQAGIFASGSIFSVIGKRLNNVRIEGLIVAAGVFGTVTLPAFATAVQGVGTVDIGNLTGRAIYNRAYIASAQLDDWWSSVISFEANRLNGLLQGVLGTNADLFGTVIEAFRVSRVEMTGGAFDASSVLALRDIGTVRADQFRNSTLLDPVGSRLFSSITASGNIDIIETNGMSGDMQDLTIDVGGSITGRVAARDIIRENFQVNNLIASVMASRDILSSSFTAGRVVMVDVGRHLRSSSFNIAGPIDSVLVDGEITNLVFESTGPDSEIGTIRAGGRLQGVITAFGPIGTIESTGSDVVADINTRNDGLRNNDGGLGMLKAARDILGTIRIFGDVGMITAGRHIGVRDAGQALDLRGNVGSISTGAEGQIYATVLIGQNLTGTITIGRVNMRGANDSVSTTDIVAFGRINALTVSGDLGNNVTSRAGGIGTVMITNGSFRQGRTILASNGSITSVLITGGHLLGNIIADGAIGSVKLVTGSDGFVGHIGVAQGQNLGVRWQSDIRNQLPPGTIKNSARNGSLIKAGTDIGTIETSGGAWESRFIAGGSISTVSIASNFRNDFNTSGRHNAIVAGTSIGTVTIGGAARTLNILAGATSLGADDTVGGTGANADVVGPGSIGAVNFNGPAVVNVSVIAGVLPTAGGAYDPLLSTRATGASSIGSVSASGTVTNVLALSGGSIGSTSAGIQRAGQSLPVSDVSLVAGASSPGDVSIAKGVAFAFTTLSGQHGTILFTGDGAAFWNPTLNRIRVNNTTTASSLTVSPNVDGGTLSNLLIQGNAAAEMGTLTINGRLNGNAIVYISRRLQFLNLGDVDVSSTSVVGSGGSIDTIKATGSFLSGQLVAHNVLTMMIGGDFGRAGSNNDATAVFRSLGMLTIGGVLGGSISSDAAITSVMAGSASGGGIRSGDRIGMLTINGASAALRVSARNSLGPVMLKGNVRDSDILAGADLGMDAEFGGSGGAADVLGNGVIDSVDVMGNFIRSNIAAGVLPGPSGFFGGSDQQVASGRSSIGNVTIIGGVVGSTVNSQQYRIISTGTVGVVMIAGQTSIGSGNFRVDALGATANPVRITDLSVNETSRIYTAVLTFNQPINASTISPALSIAEIRAGGATILPLTEGSDYTIEYNAEFNQARITFSATITGRSVAAAAALPGPGVYRFTLDAAILRGSSNGTLLDGNNDGFVGDSYQASTVVGDAGDRILSEVFNPSGEPQINIFGAADLDLVLKSSGFSGAGPQANRVFSVRGAIGDHPNINGVNFAAGSDVDVYHVSLRAGQIVRVGALAGVAANGTIGVYDSNGDPVGIIVSGFPGSFLGDKLQLLPSGAEGFITTGYNILVAETGDYYFTVSSAIAVPESIAPGPQPESILPSAGAFGAYSFTFEVFDDNDTGFQGDTASGQGATLVEAPKPSAFRGPDNMINTSDDLSSVTINGWTFTISPVNGDKTAPGTKISGSNALGWTSVRTIKGLGPKRDLVVTNAGTAVANTGQPGSPSRVAPDADVFYLNNGQSVTPGTKYRVIVKLTGTGSNIGALPYTSDRSGVVSTDPINFLGHTLFGLFEVPSGASFSDARLVAAPSEFLPVGGQTPRAFGDGRYGYGYDSNGDFYFQFVVPGSMTDGSAAKYALYLQGTINSDYEIEVRNFGPGYSSAPTEQRVLLETRGGLVDWLESRSGATTEISAFASAILGFQGFINGVPVDTYITSGILTAVRAFFAAAGVQVQIETNASAFQRQEFSTVFLTTTQPPGVEVPRNDFGISQHIDAFNADKTDEAIVFASDFSVFGLDASQASVDTFISAASIAVARRIGELLGLRLEASTGSIPQSVMSVDSVFFGPSVGAAFNNDTNGLASVQSGADRTTAFYLGSQNAYELLRQIVARV